MIDFKVENKDGVTESYNVNDIVEQLRAEGDQIKGVSPDGTMLTISDSKGDFNVKTEDILKELGWKINAVEPSEANEDIVSPQMRVAVANLGTDDTVKKMYLQSKLEERGIKNAQIVGQGTDFYYFHPETGQYFALTNKRGLDMSDVASGLSQAPGFLAGAGAGAAGFVGGSIPGAALAGAAGQAVGDVGSRLAIGYFDPAYARVASQNLGEQAKDIGINSAMSGLTAGAFKAIPAAIGAVRGAGSLGPQMAKDSLATGPISSLMRGAGWAAEEGGKVAATLAKPFVKSGTPQDLLASQLPLTQPMQGVGVAAQIPGGIMRLARKAMEKFGPAEYRQAMAGIAKNEAGDASITGIAREAGKIYGAKKGLAEEGRAAYKAARNSGSNPLDAFKAAKQTQAAQTGEAWAAKTKPIESLSGWGESLEKSASDIAGKAASTVYGAGRTTQMGGKGLRTFGKYAGPYERRFYAKKAEENTLEPLLDDLASDYLRNRKKQLQSKQDILAYTPY